MADDILNINGKLIRLKDNGDGTWSWATSVTGSVVVSREIVTSDTVVTAGSNVLFGPYNSVGARVGAGVSLGASAKWKLALQARDASTYPLGDTVIYDASTAASTNGAGSGNICGPRYALRFFNVDTVDETIKRLSMVETA